MVLCAVSLAASVAVMCVHGRSTGSEDSLVMPTCVSLPIFVVRDSVHNLTTIIT